MVEERDDIYQPRAFVLRPVMIRCRKQELRLPCISYQSILFWRCKCGVSDKSLFRTALHDDVASSKFLADLTVDNPCQDSIVKNKTATRCVRCWIFELVLRCASASVPSCARTVRCGSPSVNAALRQRGPSGQTRIEHIDSGYKYDIWFPRSFRLGRPKTRRDTAWANATTRSSFPCQGPTNDKRCEVMEIFDMGARGCFVVRLWLGCRRAAKMGFGGAGR